MRKLIVCNIISLDGFYPGRDDDVMVLPFDEGFSVYNAERLRAADTLLLGRRTFEGFKSYWPRLNGAMEKVVVERIGPGARSLSTAALTPPLRLAVVC